MKTSIASFLLTLLCLSFPHLLTAQEIDLIVSGEGTSKKQAVDNALVSAIEQAFGVYVSGDTHILNDELVRDEIIQIKRGNIKKYRTLNECNIGNSKYSATVEATVSIDNLLKFAKSKGSSCELSGKSFAANLALKQLYAKNGAEAMKQLYNSVGYIVPKMFDYKLIVGEPIIFNTDVYIPVEIDCVLNDNYDTFKEMVNTIYNQVQSSLKSAGVQGSTAEESIDKIRKYHNLILDLPEYWTFGFRLTDNIGSEVIPILAGRGGFWPKDLCAPYKINHRYDKTTIGFTTPVGAYHQLPENVFVVYKKFVIESHGPKIQKLNYDPLCSEFPGGKNLLKSYVKSVEDRYSKRRALGHTGVYGITDFDERMIEWREHKSEHDWITDAKKTSGETVCTIYFFLCYDEKDISKISDFKIEPLFSIYQ